MADNAAITVQDGQTTPVNHVFSPIRIDAKTGEAMYDNRAQTYAVGRETMGLRMSTSSRVRTTHVTLKIPKVVVETINGVAVPKVSAYGLVKAEILIPLDFSEAEAKDVRTLAKNALAHATVAAMSDTGEFVW